MKRIFSDFDYTVAEQCHNKILKWVDLYLILNHQGMVDEFNAYWTDESKEKTPEDVAAMQSSSASEKTAVFERWQYNKSLELFTNWQQIETAVLPFLRQQLAEPEALQAYLQSTVLPELKPETQSTDDQGNYRTILGKKIRLYQEEVDDIENIPTTSLELKLASSQAGAAARWARIMQQVQRPDVTLAIVSSNQCQGAIRHFLQNNVGVAADALEAIQIVQKMAQTAEEVNQGKCYHILEAMKQQGVTPESDLSNDIIYFIDDDLHHCEHIGRNLIEALKSFLTNPKLAPKPQNLKCHAVCSWHGDKAEAEKAIDAGFQFLETALEQVTRGPKMFDSLPGVAKDHSPAAARPASS